MVSMEYERQIRDQGFRMVCGVDEAGRGPLAGPVCAAAVILPDGCEIDGLDDSKKLTEKKREALFDTIRSQAVAYGIAMADEEEIDRLNILNATFLAMCRAVAMLSPPAEYALDRRKPDAKGFSFPPFASSRGTAFRPRLRQRRCSPRSRGTALCWNWTSNIPNISLPSTRDIPPPFTAAWSANTAPRRSIAKAF